MAVRVPRYADIAVANAEIASLLAPQPNSFIGDGAVPFGAVHGLPKRCRGGEHEVEQADLAWLESFGEMEAEQVIRQRRRDQIQERDLVCNSHASLPVLDLGCGQAGLVQQGAEIEARCG